MSILRTATTASARSADNAGLGIALLLGAMMLVPAMDAIAKLLSASFATLQVVWARYFFHFLLIAPIVLLRFGMAAARPPRLGLQLLRGTFLFVSTAMFFRALAFLPLADALALVFLSPLLVTAAAPFFLGERAELRRYAAVGIGLVGALIVVRPGFGVFDPAAFWALGASVTYAAYVITTRKLAGTAPSMVTLAFTASVGVVASTPLAVVAWTPPDTVQWVLMVAMGAVAAVGHFLIIRAHDVCEASKLSPLYFSEIISAAAIGWLVFGEFPDAVTWIGVAFITAGGVYISLTERRARTAANRGAVG